MHFFLNSQFWPQPPKTTGQERIMDGWYMSSELGEMIIMGWCDFVYFSLILDCDFFEVSRRYFGQKWKRSYFRLVPFIGSIYIYYLILSTNPLKAYSVSEILCHKRLFKLPFPFHTVFQNSGYPDSTWWKRCLSLLCLANNCVDFRTLWSDFQLNYYDVSYKSQINSYYRKAT